MVLAVSGSETPGRVPDDFRDVEERLRAERPQMSAVELDEVKRRAMSKASRPGRAGLLRRRAVSLIAAGGLLIAGTAGVYAAAGGGGGGSSHSAPQSQYCPDQSQAPGKPKPPKNGGCGNPKTK